LEILESPPRSQTKPKKEYLGAKPAAPCRDGTLPAVKKVQELVLFREPYCGEEGGRVVRDIGDRRLGFQ